MPVTNVTGSSNPMGFQPTLTAPYEFQCSDSRIDLYHLADNRKVSSLKIQASDDCPNWVEWTPDAGMAAVVTGRKVVYIWRTDGSAPVEVGLSQDHPLWSPLARLLAIVDAPPPDGHGSTIHVVDSSGKRLADFVIGGGGDGEQILWLTDEIICRPGRMSEPCHKATTGQHVFDLIGWHVDAAGPYVPQQIPSFSPNQRWVLLDHSYMLEANNDIRAVHSYGLFDVLNTIEYRLPDSGKNVLVFSGWKADSSAAYLVSRPLQAGALPTTDLPFGLFTLDVHSHALELVFKEAMQLTLSPDAGRGFVVFPARKGTGSVELAGGIWPIGTETLLSRTSLSPEMIYVEPGIPVHLVPNFLCQAVWSHNGQWVVIATVEGQVRLVGLDGTVRSLADHLEGAATLGVEYLWSQDDRSLLIRRYHDQAWILTVF